MFRRCYHPFKLRWARRRCYHPSKLSAWITEVSLSFRQEPRVPVSAFQEVEYKEDFEDRNLKEKAKARNWKNESRSGTACGMRGRRKKKKWSEFERNMRT